MGLEAALLSGVLKAGLDMKKAKDERKSARRIEAKRDQAEKDRRSREFQDQERERKAAQGRSRLEQSARRTAQGDVLRSRGLTPTFSSLSRAVLDRN